MLAISRNQKLLQAEEENQVSGFFLNSKPTQTIISASFLFIFTFCDNRRFHLFNLLIETFKLVFTLYHLCKVTMC